MCAGGNTQLLGRSPGHKWTEGLFSTGRWLSVGAQGGSRARHMPRTGQAWVAGLPTPMGPQSSPCAAEVNAASLNLRRVCHLVCPSLDGLWEWHGRNVPERISRWGFGCQPPGGSGLLGARGLCTASSRHRAGDVLQDVMRGPLSRPLAVTGSHPLRTWRTRPLHLASPAGPPRTRRPSCLPTAGLLRTPVTPTCA